ncbi:MAG: dual specificity protein phosphatase family protein [Thermoguttaceae bacterium]
MELDLIVPRIYVGSCPIHTDEIDRLKNEYGITAVLNLQVDEDFAWWGIDWGVLEAHYRRLGIEVRRVPVRDFSPEDLRKNLPECVGALEDLVRAGQTVYVHCSAGVNRSPSTVVAYLHWVEGWEFDEAVNYVRARHACDPYVDAIRLATEDRAGPRGGNAG